MLKNTLYQSCQTSQIFCETHENYLNLTLSRKFSKSHKLSLFYFFDIINHIYLYIELGFLQQHKKERVLNNVELQYKGLRILSQYCSCQDSDFRVWKLKKKNINCNIKWQVVKRVKPFAPSNKLCGLCLQEKLSILRSAPSLNKRCKIFGLCIHRKKFLLSNLSMSTDEVPIADRNSES